MPFLELSVRCRLAEQPRYEHALEDVGALAVTLLDADASTPDERAILEPGVGQTPLWDGIALSALFPHDADALLLLAALESFDPGLDWTRASFRNVDDQIPFLHFATPATSSLRGGAADEAIQILLPEVWIASALRASQ